MIQDEEELQITKNAAARFAAAIAALEVSDEKDTEAGRLQLDAMRSQHADLLEQIRDYGRS